LNWARILLYGHSMRLLLCALGASLLSAACGSPHEADVPGAAGEAGAVLEASVELGVPGGEHGLSLLPLADGDELRLQTFGQGGTHVIVGVRCTGLGNRAFVSATLRNLTTGVEVSEPAPARPQLLYCGKDGVCDLVPYLVHASGLTETDEEKNGLRVRLTAVARNDAGVRAEAEREVVLSTADL